MKRFFPVLLVPLLLLGCADPNIPNVPAQPQEATPETLASGLKVYTANCASCHQVDGYGVPTINASLVDDDLLPGNPNLLIKIMLKGPADVIPPGRPVYSNKMPSFSRLDDQQISDVLTYIRHEYGNKATPITAQQVQALRAQTP